MPNNGNVIIQCVLQPSQTQHHQIPILGGGVVIQNNTEIMITVIVAGNDGEIQEKVISKHGSSIEKAVNDAVGCIRG